MPVGWLLGCDFAVLVLCWFWDLLGLMFWFVICVLLFYDDFVWMLGLGVVCVLGILSLCCVYRFDWWFIVLCFAGWF